MKKLTYLAAMLMLTNFVFAGGLLTNTNQSAQFIRMLSRNASLDIDAVYYNPAGLIKLEDGWHFSVNSQTIFQDKKVYSEFPFLNNHDYLGTVQVPVFPTGYAVYKKENWAFSLGIGPNAGGGSAEFKKGLPTFEIPISMLVPGLAQLGQIDPSLAVTGYSADLYFKGSSIFWGFQLGATYKINEKLSAYAGVRILPSKNVYQGHIKDIELNVGGNMTPAGPFLSQTAGVVNGLGNASKGVANSLQPIVDMGGGTYTLSEVQQAGYMSPAQKAAIEGGLLRMGVPQEQIDMMPITGVQTVYTASGNLLIATAGSLSANAAQLEDKVVDTEQTGTGFTPVLGLNFSPNEDWNIGIKYEHKTYMTLTNKPNADNNYDLWGKNVNSDVPGVLGIGLGYKGLDWLEAQVSYTMFLDKGVDWGVNLRDINQWKSIDQSKIRHRDINSSSYEVGLGLQFNISDNFSISTGGLYGGMGADDSFQSDFSYTNPFISIGGGIMWKITDRLTLDAGVSNVFYQDQTVTFKDPNVPDYTDTYGKTSISFAAGISYSIF